MQGASSCGCGVGRTSTSSSRTSREAWPGRSWPTCPSSEQKREALRAAVADPRGDELTGRTAADERVPTPAHPPLEENGHPGGAGVATAIDRALDGRARGRWRSYPSWYLDHGMAPDAHRSRFAEAEGAIYLNAQHPDYLSAKSAQAHGDPRPMLVYQMELLWKEYLLATDPYASAARQADDLAGLVSRQKYLPARL